MYMKQILIFVFYWVEYNIIVSVIFIFIEYVEVQVYVSYRPFLLFDKKKKKPTEIYYENVYVSKI